MCLYCPLIGVKTHEELASGGKLVKIGWQRHDKGLDLRRTGMKRLSIRPVNMGTGTREENVAPDKLGIAGES